MDNKYKERERETTPAKLCEKRMRESERHRMIMMPLIESSKVLLWA